MDPEGNSLSLRPSDLASLSSSGPSVCAIPAVYPIPSPHSLNRFSAEKHKPLGPGEQLAMVPR